MHCISPAAALKVRAVTRDAGLPTWADRGRGVIYLLQFGLTRAFVCSFGRHAMFAAWLS